MRALVLYLIRLLTLPVGLVRRRLASARDGYVVLVVDGPVRDLASPVRRLRRWLGPPPRGVTVADVRALGRALEADPGARGVLVRIRALSAGPAAQASLRDALAEIRALGKDVVAHLPDGADTAALYVASAARLVLVGPETMIAPLGYAFEGRYVRRALERAGVEAEVIARGTYKSAGEELVRDAMSEAQREQLGALLEARHEALVAALARGRHVDPDVARGWIDEAPHGARDAVARGLADAVAYDDDLEEHLGAPARLVSARRYLAAHRPWLPTLRRRPFIGVVRIHGAIASRVGAGLSDVASEGRVVEALRRAHADRRVRAVVLHVDSRGGSAAASSRIHHEVRRLAEHKPVVAYLSDVAASGGYYIASAAHLIVAQPQTVTGSIGVVSARFVVAPLLERLGVVTDVVKRGAHADLFSTARRFDDADRERIAREIDAVYRTFLGVVAEGRGRPVEEIEPLAEGRVYSGVEARSRGLVDHLGGLERALHDARSFFGVDGRDLEAALVLPRESPFAAPHVPAWLSSLVGSLGLGALVERLELAVAAPTDRVLVYYAGPVD
jgi:protease-4